jgi:type I restriction enzyme S subunit
MFYKETNFQITPIGEIPEEWKVAAIEDIARVKGRIGWRGYKRTDFVEKGKGALSLGANNITEDNRLTLTEPTYVSWEKYRESPEIHVKPLDILMAQRGSLGKVAIVNRDVQEATINPNVVLLRDIKIDNFYFYYVLISTSTMKQVLSVKSSTTVPLLTQQQIKSFKIPLPPTSEQKAIVGVLGVVDSAIELVDRVIAKTERLKKGLMQTLLTKGIGHKEYKDTPIGKTPKTWQIVRLKDAVEIDKESRDPSREIPDKTFLYVDIDSVDGGTGKIRNPKQILGKKAPSRARRVIHENDVIMSTVRPYLKAFAIVPRELDGQICSTGFAVLSCGSNILPYFLLNILFSSQIINQCNRMMVGGQYPALNQSQVSEIRIPLPPLSEQQKIADAFLSVDRKLELERNEKTKLERIKQSLMDLLLTGKIRVKVD